MAQMLKLRRNPIRSVGVVPKLSTIYGGRGAEPFGLAQAPLPPLIFLWVTWWATLDSIKLPLKLNT